MSQRFEKLKTLLKELFQLDQPELDFGIYRVLHSKSTEVSKFLDEDLLPQVRAALDQFRTADNVEIERDLATAVKQARELGVDPDTTKKVQELRAKLRTDAVDIDALESEVYDHLFSFFRRYYSEGDYLSKRVYKPGVYAIPYEGEEVALHWANKDQYYIKTSEYLRDYSFRLRPHDGEDPLRVHFRLADAAEGCGGNFIDAEARDRVFILAPPGESGHDFILVEDGEQGKELVILFEFRPATIMDWPREQREGRKKPPVQRDLSEMATRRVLESTDGVSMDWINELSKAHVLGNGEQADCSRLEAHLKRYAVRNTFDYFVHKDLGTFLRRELDFYIKNEVMHLDDVEDDSAPRLEQFLSKIRVLRKVAGKIIDFLAQLEDFQRRLWLKRKFVVDTQYCLSLGCIPEQFYQEIAENDAQREEWVRLLSIDGIKSDLTVSGYSKKLKPGFLRGHPTLMVDTRLFDSSFTTRLLDAIDDLEEQVDGVLFHSENYQALLLMQAKYREGVQCVYLDPPYNTDASAIDYKNGYKKSSWMSLLDDRLLLSRELMSSEGVLIAAIDDEQQRELSFLLSGNFPNRLLGTICVRANPSGRPTQSGYSVSHEYLLFAGKSAQSVIGRMPPTEAQMARFAESDEEGRFEWRNLRREGSNSDRTARPALFYPIYIRKSALRVPRMQWDEEERKWHVLEPAAPDETAVWPLNASGIEKTWRWEWETVTARRKALGVRPDRSGLPYVYIKRRPHAEGVVSVSSWFDAKYSATEHGTALLKAMFGGPAFSYPKSIHAVVDAIYIGGARDPRSVVLDHFAGSGTTGHAVINLNRRDGGRRQFILVEAGDHFDTVLLPRIKKASFAPEWRDGKPKHEANPEEAKRSPRIVKVLRLESYEDTLNNLEARRSKSQQLLIESPEAQGVDGLREEYILKYMLDVETRGSQSLLNVRAFSDPTAYKLRVKRSGSDESSEVNVDLLETFNWLIGLRVRRIGAPRSYSASFRRDEEQRLQLQGEVEAEEGGPYWFRTVSGTTLDGRMALVVWRRLTGEPERDNLVLDEWFRKEVPPFEERLGVVYVNGSNNLENLKGPEDSWRVRLIEEEFHRLMFESDEQ